LDLFLVSEISFETIDESFRFADQIRAGAVSRRAKRFHPCNFGLEVIELTSKMGQVSRPEALKQVEPNMLWPSGRLDEPAQLRWCDVAASRCAVDR
jgi:hypothetical protein